MRTEVFHRPPHALCPHCHEVLVLRPIPWSYFEGKLESCPKCAAGVDAHQLVLSALVGPGFEALVLAAVGAQSTHILFTLEPGIPTSIRFVDHSIPADARIVGVNYTPQGDPDTMVFPLEIHGNRPVRYLEPNERHLFPMPFGKGTPAPTQVGVTVTWVPNPKSVDLSWDLLVEAFHRYQIGQLAAAVIPANTAVDMLSARVLTSRIQTVAKKEDAESFLKNAGTYAQRLKVLLPLLAKCKGIPWLRADIHGSLIRLNSLRNELAHRGEPKIPLTRNDVAAGLCAALFAIQYLRFAEPLFMKD